MPKKKDENELAKSVIDDIIAETESDDWDKKKPQKKSTAKNSTNQKSNKSNSTSTGPTLIKQS